MSKISKEYGNRAKDASERAKTAHSPEEGHTRRKREKALDDMADSQNWLYTSRNTREVHKKRRMTPIVPVFIPGETSPPPVSGRIRSHMVCE